MSNTKRKKSECNVYGVSTEEQTEDLAWTHESGSYKIVLMNLRILWGSIRTLA